MVRVMIANKRMHGMYSGRCGLLMGGLLALVLGCDSLAVQVNPYLTLSEFFGVPIERETGEGAAGGLGTEATFRRQLTVTFNNNNTDAEVDTSFVAWVNVSSIRSAQQQDALLIDGYRQLREGVSLGTAFTLPVGTYVYDGGGTAGATAVLLGPSQAEEGEVLPATMSLALTTPDAILVFSQMPVSCDSVAFILTDDGAPLTAVPAAGPEAPYSGATGRGAFKTLAQVSAYQCDPFRPGLFFRQGGGAPEPNDYFEGEDITFDFNLTPDANGDFCIVTIGADEEAAEGES